MNKLDLAIIVIFIVCIYIASRRGLIGSLVRMLSFVVSLIVANRLYPIVSARLKAGSNLYPKLYDWVFVKLNFGSKFAEVGRAQQNQFIEGLGLPNFITEKLIENNNIEVYKLFNTSALEEYITHALAGFLLNVISLVLVFIIVLILVNIVGSILNLFAKLPVIRTLNKFGGGLMGAAMATIIIWCLVLVLVFLNPNFVTEIQSTVIAKYFLTNNLLLSMVLNGFV